MKKYTLEELIEMSASHRGGGVWVMSREHYDHIRFSRMQDHSGMYAYDGPSLSGYGRLLGRMIAIVDID